MSRIGKTPIPVPAGVEVTLEPAFVRVKGPKGTLERGLPREISVEREGDQLVVTRPSDSGQHRSLHGLTRTLVANLITGVTSEFTKTLEVHGVGYRAILKGTDLELMLGYSHPVSYPAPPGIAFEVVSARPPHTITVRGADKELVGQVAAEIRAKRKPEPYKQKGIRYQGEVVRKKAGKTSK
ncbi:MAG: 50S ribosomal protein L6 [Actinomycetota bacterium]